MKIENRSRKQSHKFDGIGVGRTRSFPFLPIPFTTPSLMIQWKLGCRSRKQKRKNQPIAKSGSEHCHWFILPLLLATPTMQFSIDRKQRRHKHNQCSASDSVWFSLDRIALPFWLRLRLRLRRYWKPAFTVWPGLEWLPDDWGSLWSRWNLDASWPKFLTVWVHMVTQPKSMQVVSEHHLLGSLRKPRRKHRWKRR